jgi:hypothetical protein
MEFARYILTSIDMLFNTNNELGQVIYLKFKPFKQNDHVFN